MSVHSSQAQEQPERKRRRRGRGEGSITYRAHLGRWEGKLSLGYNADGKRIRVSVYGRTKREVQEKLEQLKQDAREGLPVQPTKITVREHFEDWLRAKKQSVTSATYLKYCSLVRTHIEPRIGHIRLHDLDYRQIDLLYEALDELGLSRSTVADVAALLRRGLDDAVRKRLIRENPARLAASRSPGKGKARYLTQAEIDVFLRAAKGERLEDFFVVALSTGLRPGELLGLPWDAIDWEQQTLEVRQALHEEGGRLFLGPPKSQAAYRTISLSDVAIQALRRQRKRQAEERLRAGDKWTNKDDLVFTDQRGGYARRTNILRRDLRRILNRAAVIRVAERLGYDADQALASNGPHLPQRALREGDYLLMPDGRQVQVSRRDLLEGVGLHTFRHTHASLLIFAGVDPKTVSQRLGHEDVAFTLRTYAHIMPGQDRQAARAVDRLLSLPS